MTGTEGSNPSLSEFLREGFDQSERCANAQEAQQDAERQ